MTGLVTHDEEERRGFPRRPNDYWWSGFMAFNADNSWHIHELAPGLLAMLGCNGRGVVLATLWGRELARYAAGVAAREFVLPPSAPRRLWLHSVARPLVSGLIRYCARPAARRRAPGRRIAGGRRHVADTLQALSGVVPEETEALMRQATKAIIDGKMKDPDLLALQQIDALIEMGRYFYDACWTPPSWLRPAAARIARRQRRAMQPT